jgi:uncharacterized protein YciI
MGVRAVATLFAAVLAPPAGSLAAELPQGEPEMTLCQFVLLRQRPDARPMDEPEVQRLQEQHLAYVGRLFEEGKALLAGPLDGGGALRGAMVLAAGTVDEAQALLGQDPWVGEGRFEAEVHPWWTAKDVLRKPAGPYDLSRCYLALLLRPPGAPDYPEEKRREIQADHLAHLRAMADSGELAVAGPMGDDGRLRGILVFRALDPERIRERIAQDPAVKAGRLEAEIYPWHVPDGALPEPPSR